MSNPSGIKMPGSDDFPDFEPQEAAGMKPVHDGLIGEAGDGLTGFTSLGDPQAPAEDYGWGQDGGMVAQADEDETPVPVIPAAAPQAAPPQSRQTARGDASQRQQAQARPEAVQEPKKSLGKRIAKHAPIIFGFVAGLAGTVYGVSLYLDAGSVTSIPPAPQAQQVRQSQVGSTAGSTQPMQMRGGPTQELQFGQPGQPQATTQVPPAPNVIPSFNAQQPTQAIQGSAQPAIQAVAAPSQGQPDDIRVMLTELRSFITEMRDRQKALESQGLEATEAYKAISGRIEDLEKRVAKLETPPARKKVEPKPVAAAQASKPKAAQAADPPVRESRHTPGQSAATYIPPAQPAWRTNGPAVAPAATASRAMTPVWRVRAAMPGVAWIAPEGATKASDFIKVTAGQTFSQFGQVIDVRQDANGWVVVTSNGEIRG